MIIRELSTGDRNALENFRCGLPGQPITMLAETMIRDLLYSELKHRAHTVLGLFDDEELMAVIAWRPHWRDQTLWNSSVLAVRRGAQRQGFGRLLKQEMLTHARAVPSIRAVVSEVHVDNIAMQRLNVALGAICKPDPDDADYLICTILVSSD